MTEERNNPLSQEEINAMTKQIINLILFRLDKHSKDIIKKLYKNKKILSKSLKVV